MRTMLTILVGALTLGACAPLEGNAPIGLLAREFEVTAEVTAMHHDLGKIELSIVSWDELHWMCRGFEQDECAGLTRNRSTPHGHLIFMVEPPRDRCEWVAMPDNPEIGHRYARTAIHEFLHAAHFQHGLEMDALEAEAWELYKERYCK